MDEVGADGGERYRITTEDDMNQPAQSTGTSRARRVALGLGIGAAAGALDQATKAIALAELSTVERIPLLGDLLGLQLAFNSGTVMSLGSGLTWIFTVVATLAVLTIPVLIFRSTSKLGTVALGLIWGGAVGNLIDRLFAEPGFAIGRVTDFLSYGELFIGNLADVALVVGLGLAAIGFLGQRQRPGAPQPPAEEPPT